MDHAPALAIVSAVLVYNCFWKLLLALLLWKALCWLIWEHKVRVPAKKDFRVCVVGAGFSGITAAIKLKEAGLEYEVFEAASEIGGTWFANAYPGCACDVESTLYSLSFEPNPLWSGSHASREEIWRYMQAIVIKHKLNVHLNSKVDSIRWDNKRMDYAVTLSSGMTHYFNVVIHAVGPLREPVMPDIDGSANFQGEFFHSSKWKDDCDVSGKRVGVIGTGASAVQIVPTICKKVDQLYVFQRTPCWVAPRNERRYSRVLKAIFRYVPGALYAHRLFLFARNEFIYFITFRNNWVSKRMLHLWVSDVKKRVKDQSLAEKLTPSFMPGCKRITSSDDYLESYNLPNVHLVTSKIDKVTESGIRTSDGVETKLDVLVYATGHSPLLSFRQAFRIYNGDGTLLNDEIVKQTPRAYLGITVPNFPNLFLTLGPNTGLGHNSVLWMVECQVDYIVKCLRNMLSENVRGLHPKQRSMDRFSSFLANRLPSHVFGRSGCSSWYLNEQGENYTLWPSHLLYYWWKTKIVDNDDYVMEK